MKKEKEANKGEVSGLLLQGFEVVFFRKHLGLERVVPELGQVRANYIQKVLLPVLKDIDTQVEAMRNASAEKLPNGNFKTNEAGEISYGSPENTKKVRKEFERIISADIFLPILDKAEFLTIRDIFTSLKQELDENDTEMYLHLVEKLKNVDIKSITL